MLKSIQTNPYVTIRTCVNVGCDHKGSPKNYIHEGVQHHDTLLAVLKNLKYGEYSTKYSDLTEDELLGKIYDSKTVVNPTTVAWDDPIAATEEFITRLSREGKNETYIALYTAAFINTLIAKNPAYRKWFTECELKNIIYISNVLEEANNAYSPTITNWER